jgi:hypothetical protein
LKLAVLVDRFAEQGMDFAELDRPAAVGTDRGAAVGAEAGGQQESAEEGQDGFQVWRDGCR